MGNIKKLVFDSRTVFLGKGAVRLLPEKMHEKGLKHAFVCTDHSLVDTEMFHGFIKILVDSGFATTIFDQIVPNPRAEDIMAGSAKFLESQADCVIGFGGGSVLDSTKAIAAVSCNEGDIIEYNTHWPKRRFLKNKKYCTICIPTTAGTGSEMDAISVIVNQDGHKVNVIDPLLACNLAFIDPAMTYSCPPRVTASCGFDAMMHSFEAVMGNPDMFFDNVSMRGIKLVYDCLEGAYQNRADYYKDRLMEASVIGGFSMANEPADTLVPIHSIGLPLAEQYHLSHGQSLAAVAPYVIDMIIERTDPYAIAKIGRYCGIEEADSYTCAKIFNINLQMLIDHTDLALPDNLKAGQEEIRRLASQAVKSGSTTKNGILSFDFDMCCHIYYMAFQHKRIVL